MKRLIYTLPIALIIASCGGSSSSTEATESAQEEETAVVEEVVAVDPVVNSRLLTLVASLLLLLIVQCSGISRSSKFSQRELRMEPFLDDDDQQKCRQLRTQNLSYF